MASLTCVCISDTHNKQDELGDLPPGDVLIHAGDATYYGEPEEFLPFAMWFFRQPYKHKLLVPGNHDFHCQKKLPETEDFFMDNGARMLVDNGVTIEGVHFYGTPWVPNLLSWAFSFEDGSPDLEEKFAWIPERTDVLISHGPAWGRLDKVPIKGWAPAGSSDWMTTVGERSVGSETLEKVLRARPNIKYHVHGHIHESYGVIDGYGQKMTTINASICTRHYEAKNKPISFVIPVPESNTESVDSNDAQDA